MSEAETEWIDAVNVKSLLIICPNCGITMYIGSSGIVHCNCGISWRVKTMIQEAV